MSLLISVAFSPVIVNSFLRCFSLSTDNKVILDTDPNCFNKLFYLEELRSGMFCIIYGYRGETEAEEGYWGMSAQAGR